MVFNTVAESVTAVVGGHIDIVAATPSTILQQMQAGRLRVIGITAPQRVPGLYAQSPTWREQGVDSAYTSWRVIVAPKGTNDDDVRKAAEVFAKLAALPQWRTELERNYWIGNYLAPKATRSFLAAQWTEHRQLLGQLGLAQ